MTIGNYYNQKKRALMALESWIKRSPEGFYKSQLIYDLTLTFEIGERTLIQRIELMKEIGKIKEEDGVLIWIKRTSKNELQSDCSPMNEDQSEA